MGTLGIVMAIMMLVTNLFVILVVRLTMVSNFDYKAGSYLGVHIPADKKEDDEVTSLMSRTKKQFNVFNNVNMVLSVAICGICVVDMIIFIFVYILWIIIYIVGIQLVIIIGHRKIYDIKLKNGWLIEAQKKVYIDTRLSSSVKNPSISMRYHWIFIGLTVVLYIPVVIVRHSDMLFRDMSIYFIVSIIVAVALYIFNIYVNSSERTVYSENSDVNITMNQIYKKYVSLGLVIMSLFNTVAFSYIVAEYMLHGILYGGDVIVYTIVDLIGSIIMLASFVVARRKRTEVLAADDTPLYVDDDEYWKYGFYYNPNDRHIIVKNRMYDMNYAFNYASRGAQILVALLTVIITASIIFTVAALIPFINIKMDVYIADDTFMAEGGGYKCSINIGDIQEVQLFDEMPKDNFTRTNGGSTDEYDVGNYKGRTYGRCMLFIWDGYSPVLMIKSSNKTVFVNSKEDGYIRQMYDELVSYASK